MTMTTRYEELQKDVRRFHRLHPKVWQLFCKFTFERINQGFKHYAVNGIFERIRWETDLPTASSTTFKINNNYRPFYARRFMAAFPDHEGFFRTRRQFSKDKPATHRPEYVTLDHSESAGTRGG